MIVKGATVKPELLDVAAAGPDQWMVLGLVGLSALGGSATATLAALARHLPTALACACFSGLSLGVGLALSGFVAAGLLTMLVMGAAVAVSGAAFLGLSEKSARARRPVQAVGAVFALLVMAAFGLSGIVLVLGDENGHWLSDAISASDRIYLPAAPDFAPALAGLCGAFLLMAGALAVHAMLGRDARSFGSARSQMAPDDEADRVPDEAGPPKRERSSGRGRRPDRRRP